MPRIALTLALLSGVTSPLLAHPGHGITEPQSATHYLLEPVHIAPVLVVALVLALAGRLVWRRSKQQDDLQRVKVRKN